MMRRTATLLALVVFVLMSGCTRAPEEPRPVAREHDATAGTPASEAPSATAGPLPLERIEFSTRVIASGLRRPLLVTNAGDGSGRLFIVEQQGTVRVARDGALARKPYLDIRPLVTSGGERGLLGLAFEPGFASGGRLYVNYTDTRGDTIVARFTADDPGSDTPKLRGPEVLLRVRQPYANHNGGCLAFGPDGHLWIGMGDGGSAGDPQGNAQNPASMLGKMLAMDVSATVPRARIVVRGLRNPWRFSFDRVTGDLWIGDVGQNAWEEIDVLRAGSIEGANLGWNLWEGSHPYLEGARPKRRGYRFPVIEYGHDEGRSVTGGHVYRGVAFPPLQGTYLYADFEEGWVAGVRIARDDGADPPRVTEQRVLLRDAGSPSSFGEDEEGEIHLCDYGSGTVWRIEARAQ